MQGLFQKQGRFPSPFGPNPLVSTKKKREKALCLEIFSRFCRPLPDSCRLQRPHLHPLPPPPIRKPPSATLSKPSRNGRFIKSAYFIAKILIVLKAFSPFSIPSHRLSLPGVIRFLFPAVETALSPHRYDCFSWGPPRKPLLLPIAGKLSAFSGIKFIHFVIILR